MIQSTRLAAPDRDETGDEPTAPTAEDGRKELSKLRHQLNNHLTVALAEAQMVLLELGPGEARGHCERIHEQLRAIARAVAATRTQG